MIILFILALSLSYYHPFLVVEAQFVDNVVDHHHHHHSISKWNTLDAALLVFLLISIYCIACRYFDVYGRRSGSILTQETAGQDHDVGLDRCIVEGFPVFAYSDVSGLGLEKVPLECAVCLGQFEKDEKLCMLPKCEHMFHLECVDRWLAGHTTCPLCRAELAARPDRLIKEDPNRVDLSRTGSSGTVGDTIINIA